MNSFVFIFYLSISVLAAPESALPRDQWKTKLDGLLLLDSEYNYNDHKLELVETQTTQSKLYFVPRLDLYYSSTITKDASSFKNFDYGLMAQVNLFQFGKSQYRYLSQNSTYEYEKLEHRQKRIQIENKLLTTLFTNTLLQRKLSLYKQIENLKKKAFRVAQQRYERGNLARQQVDKVEIDLANLNSQRTSIERELANSELEILKYQLDNFKREWPFSNATTKNRKARKPDEFADVKILNFKSDSYEYALKSTRSGYLPSIDLSGKTFERKLDSQPSSHEWDISLTVSWPIWDNYNRSIENQSAYRDFQFWQTEKTRTVRDWDKKVKTKEDQLDSLSAQLTQSAENLKKLNALYTDTEALFSQGRITVNEMFQDQQLLLETQINYENELNAFHQYLLEYCGFYSERIWECF